MNLTQEQYNKMKAIKNKMAKGKAKSKEMKEFLGLLIHSSDNNKIEVERYIVDIGFKSLDDFKNHLNRKIENEETVKNLAIVGGGLLLAFLLVRK
jgi:metal-responsive CopG/Arc/MetJ family transcriptional regulator